MSSSNNLYLSGEPNAPASSALETKFQFLMSQQQQQQPEQEQETQPEKAKIQIIHSNSHEDDNELPPPIEECHVVNKNIEGNNDPPDDNATSNHQQINEEELSLMEQLMKEGLKAREAASEERILKTRKDSQKSSFGSLQRGFLNASSRVNKNKEKNNTSRVGRGGQDIVKKKIQSLPRESTSPSTPSSIETLPKSNDNTDTSVVNPLRFDEVQDAMSNQKSIWEQSLDSKLTSPQLMDRLIKNKIVSQRMSHPKYMAALEALQKNPKEAREKFQNHPDVMEFIHEICKELGEYFIDVGREESRDKPIDDISKKQEAEAEIGCLAYNALQQREYDRSSSGQSLSSKETTISKEEQEQIDNILKNEELTTLLMDVDMQRVIKECSEIPGKAQMYLQHEFYSSKLRILIQSGLLKFA